MGIDKDYFIDFVKEAIKCPEMECIEFKNNNNNPEEIGEAISALSNSAALYDHAHGYVIWGIENDSRKIVGTKFNPNKEKKGQEALISWLMRLTSPNVDFIFCMVEVQGKPIVVLEIPRASNSPTRFSGKESIRIGSYTKSLKDYPEKERALWKTFDRTPFESLKAKENVNGNEVLSLLDTDSIFNLLQLPPPATSEKRLERLSVEHMISQNPSGSWDILNLGAILFARDLNQFKHLTRKVVRLITYQGENRFKTIRESHSRQGYAAGFQPLIEFLSQQLPTNEVISKALRKVVPMYPRLAVRELLANALIHQDFSITGTGPMIELFADRLEITNPGQPLVPTIRFLDAAPRSRNEATASFMRRSRICEERGSGIDKVVIETEIYQLPAPIFDSQQGSTKAILFSHKKFNEMDSEDKIRACYLHACLRYVQRDHMTNTSLRERFKIESHNSSIVSRIIRDTIRAGLIKPYDPKQAKKNSKYIPGWA